MSISKSIRKLVKATVLATPFPELVVRYRARKQITVLGYHRIAPLPEPDYPFDPESVSATPEEFARELAYLRRHLDIISTSDLWDCLEGRSTLPERPAVITFDDGYRDNAEIAVPLLREAGLHACFFLPTHLVGTANLGWWDQVACCMKHSRVDPVPSPFGHGDPPYATGPARREESIQRFIDQIWRHPWSTVLRCLDDLRSETGVDPSDYAERPVFMSWEAARAMSDAGMEIGGHTRTHPVVSHLEDPATVRGEVAGCYEDIEAALGRPPIAFAYPGGFAGAMSEAGDEAIREAGFKISFSYIHALASRDIGVTRIPRLHTSFGEDHGLFRQKMVLAQDLSRRSTLRAVPPACSSA